MDRQLSSAFDAKILARIDEFWFQNASKFLRSKPAGAYKFRLTVMQLLPLTEAKNDAYLAEGCILRLHAISEDGATFTEVNAKGEFLEGTWPDSETKKQRGKVMEMTFTCDKDENGDVKEERVSCKEVAGLPKNQINVCAQIDKALRPAFDDQLLEGIHRLWLPAIDKYAHEKPAGAYKFTLFVAQMIPATEKDNKAFIAKVCAVGLSEVTADKNVTIELNRKMVCVPGHLQADGTKLVKGKVMLNHFACTKAEDGSLSLE